jgi:hypothetical protein
MKAKTFQYDHKEEILFKAVPLETYIQTYADVVTGYLCLRDGTQPQLVSGYQDFVKLAVK